MKVYIFGLNSLSRIIAQYIEKDDRYSIQGFTVGKEYYSQSEFIGYPIIPFESIRDDANDVGVINCVGFSNQMRSRKEVSQQIENSDLKLLTYVHPRAYIGDVGLGKGSVVMVNAVVETGSVVGEGCVLYGGSYISHDTRIGAYNWLSANCVLAGHVTVGDHCFIGINASVREHIVVGSYSVLGAGTVVVKNVPESVTVVGNPAHILIKE